jgi:hypothetical protein
MSTGGAVAQLFLYPPTIVANRDLRRGPLTRKRRAFIIRHARLDAEAVAVERSIFSIAGRAISSMIHYSGNSDILRLQLTAVRDGVDFNLAYIGEDFAVKHKDIFDPIYMQALFDYGYRLAAEGYPWEKGHPRFLARAAQR